VLIFLECCGRRTFSGTTPYQQGANHAAEIICQADQVIRGRPQHRTFRPTAFELNDRYNRQFTEVMRRTLKPDSTALDIGAHRGLMLREVFAVAPQGRHFAFEPIPYLADTLIQDYPSARVYCTAFGEATFHHLPNSPEESGLKLHRTYVPNPGNDDIFDTIVGNLGMSLSTMIRWLERKRPDTKVGFRKEYGQGNEFYFMAY
jgi:hypothetical protein